MKTYYSIVSISTNPSLNEKFNIGLLCVTPNDTFFHFSETKFKIISKLLSPNGSKLALSALNGIDKKINSTGTEHLQLFEKENLSMVAEPYVNYLSRYNNNLVQFSETTTIDLNIDFEVFKVLFKKYIYSEEVFETIVHNKKPLFTSVRNHFRKMAEPFANTNFQVNKKIITGLIAPVTVDVFGKNGAIVSGHALDFEKKILDLQSELSSYLYLVDHAHKKDKKSKSFILGNEPSKKEAEHHALWSEVRNSGLAEIVPINESERIIEYMQEKGVKPII